MTGIYKLFMKQSGEGCDYTIACGEKLVDLDALNMEEAEIEAKKVLESYGINQDEVSLDKAEIMEISKSTFIDLSKIEKETEQEEANMKEAEDKQELARLKGLYE